MRLFVDTSVTLAACASVTGASRKKFSEIYRIFRFLQAGNGCDYGKQYW
jgi:hypothetical protein